MAAELPTITCPAGQPALLGTACRCAIERSLILQPQNRAVVPAVRAYCAGNYAACPTWRQRRDEWAADRHREADRELALEARGQDGE